MLKYRSSFAILSLFAAFAVASSLPYCAGAAEVLEWKDLPALPDEHGFAGPFAGVSGGALIVAGGANFPNGYPWDGGPKVWHDRIFVLETPDGKWKELPEKLPRPTAYGMSVTLPNRDSALFIGGDEENKANAEVREVTWRDGKLALERLPDLPVASTMGCAALVGETVYVAGGTGGDGSAHARFFALDLGQDQGELKWEELPWPESAAGRILAGAGVLGDKFYLFSGADLGSDKWDKRTYLKDAWEYAPGEPTGAWRRLADLPISAAAGPSLAIPDGGSRLLLVSGANREFVEVQRAARPETNGNGVEHPGFPRTIRAYDALKNIWSVAGEFKMEGRTALPPVTTTAVLWGNQWILPTGEIKPGIRSPQILAGTVAKVPSDARASTVVEEAADVPPPPKLEPKKLSFGTLNWIVVILYLGGMVGIGYWFSKRNKSTDDYFRGGQRIPWWVAGLSIFATMLSAITFMAIPARAYATDMSWYIGQLPILIVVPIVIKFYLPFFRKMNVTSAYEYLERRFSIASRIFASTSFILYHIGRVAIVLYLPALALSQVSSIDVLTCIAIIGVLCVIYTVMGGIEAVVWTDAIQAVVLMGGALLCLILVFANVDGGVSGVWDIAVKDEKLFQSLSWDFSIADGTTSFFVLLIAFTFNALVPYTSGQDVVQRYVTTATEREAAKSLKTTIFMSLTGGLLFFALGVAIYAFYQTHPAQLDPVLSKGDGILPFFIFQQLDPGVAGLVIAALFAAAQSTVSSSLNSVATAYVTDFHKRLFKPNDSDRRNLFVARIVVVVLGTVGIVTAGLLAEANLESAFKVFNSMIGLTAGALGGLFALGVFNRNANARGAIVGAVIGFVAVIGVSLSDLDISGLLYATIGFLTCFLVGSVVSLATGGRGTEK